MSLHRHLHLMKVLISENYCYYNTKNPPEIKKKITTVSINL